MTDAEYFARRAEQEVKLAQQATDPAAVWAHYQLSTAYLERLDPTPPANDGTEDAA
jgi:hypothetical protein